jgi:hypothetical protein
MILAFGCIPYFDVSLNRRNLAGKWLRPKLFEKIQHITPATVRPKCKLILKLATLARLLIKLYLHPLVAPYLLLHPILTYYSLHSKAYEG